MESVIFLLIVGFVIYWLFFRRKQSMQTTKASSPKPEIKISVSMNVNSSSSIEIPNTGAVCATGDGGWVLNSKSTFLLTIYGVNSQTADGLKEILDKNYALGMRVQARELASLIARSNLRCKEIDEYMRKFKPQYLNRIEQLKRASSEWAAASEKDRADLLTGFRQDAIDALDVRPYCDLEILFEYEPADATLDDALLDRFGYDNLQLYLRYASNLEKVRVIPADHYDRSGFEKLCGVGLATRGMEIPLPAVLETLKLKDMEEFVKDLALPPFRRKAQAIEFLTGLPDIKERVSKAVAFRELFQLRPLPQEFSHVDVRQISAAWRYASEVAMLIAHTYTMAGYATRDQKQYQQRNELMAVDGWEVMDAGDASCPFCQRAAAKTYAKNSRPKVPLHVGCRCSVVPKIRKF